MAKEFIDGHWYDPVIRDGDGKIISKSGADPSPTKVSTPEETLAITLSEKSGDLTTKENSDAMKLVLKKLFSLGVVMLFFVGLAFSQEKLTDNEALKGAYLQLQYKANLQEMQIIAARHKELQEGQPGLLRKITDLDKEILEAHGMEGGAVNWQTKTVQAPPETLEEGLSADTAEEPVEAPEEKDGSPGEE